MTRPLSSRAGRFLLYLEVQAQSQLELGSALLAHAEVDEPALGPGHLHAVNSHQHEHRKKSEHINIQIEDGAI